MDEMKIKLMGILKKKVSPDIVPIVCPSFNNYDTNTTGNADCNETVQTPKSEEMFESDNDILQQIEDVYFMENNVNISRHEIIKLSDPTNATLLSSSLRKLKSQLVVVTKRLFYMILQKQPSCENELERIQEIQYRLSDCLQHCQETRKNLSFARKSLATTNLIILSNHNRKKNMLILKALLDNIKTLLATEKKMDELMSSGDYCGCISLLLECQKATTSYREFKCVETLSNKLRDKLVMAEECLDEALAKICFKFESEAFASLQAAFKMLGKKRIAMDQLHMHYTSAIGTAAFNVVFSFVANNHNPVTKKSFADLCKMLDCRELVKCLQGLCQQMWNILLSYKLMVDWHNSNKQNEPTEGDFENSINEQYITQKLESRFEKLWHDVQSHVNTLIINVELTSIQFDEFLSVLTILHKLKSIGEEFCGSNCSELQSSIRDQCVAYFMRYHNSRLEELRLFLENEAWSPCPVKNNFNLFYLQEFKPLRFIARVPLEKHDSCEQLSGESSASSGYFSCQTSNSPSPFGDRSAPDFDDTYVCDDLSYDSEEDASPIKTSLVSDSEPHVILTNTTLMVLRYCGKYLQISWLLRTLSCEVITALRHLFEYYLYSIYIFFVDKSMMSPSNNKSYTENKLQAIIKRIQENLLFDPEIPEPSSVRKVMEPSLSPLVNLNDPEQLYGLKERLVGTESLIFLTSQFEILKDHLEHLSDGNEDCAYNLNIFYSQIIGLVPEIRGCVVDCVVRQSISTKHIVDLMSNVNWEVNDVMSQHSPYVDVLLREIQIFIMRLELIRAHISLSQEVTLCFWQSIADDVAEIFVEGFSNVKKCSHGGRALMQLDYTQLMSKLESMSSIKPFMRREFVESYIKAYYLPEPLLRNWIRDHTDYTSKQLLSLISCACGTNKIARKRLVEELDHRN